jgi:hypothetical protein
VNFTTNYTSRESRTYIEIENPLAGYTKDPIACIPQGLYKSTLHFLCNKILLLPKKKKEKKKKYIAPTDALKPFHKG